MAVIISPELNGFPAARFAKITQANNRNDQQLKMDYQSIIYRAEKER